MMKSNPNLTITATVDLNEEARQQLLHLWNAEYPENILYHTIAEFDEYLHKLKNLTHLLLTTDKNKILGWAFSFERENEKWFAIILSQAIQGQGFGTKMLDRLKQTENILNGWVVDHNNSKKRNGQTYNSPLAFYRKCDFEVIENERLETDTISAVKIRWTAKKA